MTRKKNKSSDFKKSSQNQKKVIYGPTLWTEQDIHLFKEGNHFQLYRKLGAHQMEVQGKKGVYFSVWAPNAKEVSVIADFNGWDPSSHPLAIRWDGSGIWEGFIPGVNKGEIYKYHILSQYNNYKVDKGDPFAFSWEVSPQTASKVWDLDYEWEDREWMDRRKEQAGQESPVSIYEVHVGSWMRVTEENNRFLNYREMASQLVHYVKDMGFTHVEFLPVMEHPFYGSWGYQTAGYFAPSSRYGTPQDFMFLVDKLHQNGIGVILDWVPSHFPSDEHGLGYFDGTHLYEHRDPRKGFHPDWKSYIFNYGRREVRSFLISSALFWLHQYHADGIRVDAVASMLYLDYSRKEGEWVPNPYGGRENLEAISFIKRLNKEIYGQFPGAQAIAEESTAWPMVTKPVHIGGLGFGKKWNMGWMHDTLQYMSTDPVFRKHNHNRLTFSLWYAFSENYILPLSHDEVVHGKSSLLNKMPGEDWQKFTNLRLLLGYLFTHPGEKLLFMGGEIGQRREWSHEESLEWSLLEHKPHKGIQKWVRNLNRMYKEEGALHLRDFDPDGFEWIDFSDWEKSIVSYLRKGKNAQDSLLVVCNFTPVPRSNYRVGVPSNGFWRELLNSDAQEFGGSGQGNMGGVSATPVPFHGKNQSLSLTLPPLGFLVLKKEKKG